MRQLWLCTLLLPSLALAEVYRWTDANGRVHFGETPQAGAVQVEVKPQVIQRDAATVERETRTERFFAARREEQQQAAAVNRQEQAKQAQDCQRLRDSQAQLGQGGTFYKDDGKGGRSYYSDEEIDAARRRLSAQVAERCR